MISIFFKFKPLLKLLIFIPIIFYFGKRSLIAYDEGFYALQSRWIIEKSNWIGPMWWDEVTSDRTIGIQFLIALSKKLSAFLLSSFLLFRALRAFERLDLILCAPEILPINPSTFFIFTRVVLPIWSLHFIRPFSFI